MEVTRPRATISLRDLTGFNGRCDAVVLTKDDAATPPNEAAELAKWRRGCSDCRRSLKMAAVTIWFSWAAATLGMGTAISAARMGCEVALIQNRPVLGGAARRETVDAPTRMPDGYAPPPPSRDLQGEAAAPGSIHPNSKGSYSMIRRRS